MVFGNKKLKELREAKGISQEEFAAELGVSRVTVSHWETGSNSPSLEKIGEIGSFFGVPPKYFINESQNQ
jgi:transcriptional regulator with XRE-family HTH domain